MDASFARSTQRFKAEDSARGPSLRSNVQWTIVSYIAYGACQWLMLIAVARFGLPEMVGQFALAMAVTTPIILLIGLDLRAVQVTDQSNQYQFADFLSLRIATLCVAMIVIGLLSVGYGYRGERLLLIVVMGIAKCIEAVSDLCHGTLQQYEQFDKMAKARILRGVLGLLALAAGLYLFQSLVLATAMMALVWTGVLLWHDWPLLFDVLPQDQWSISLWRFRQKDFWRLLVVAIPTGVLGCQASLEQSLPRLYVDRYLGERELGIYSAVSSLIIAVMMIVNAVHCAVLPRIAKHVTDGQWGSTWSLLVKLSFFGAILGGISIVAVAVCGDWFLEVAFGSAYSEQSSLLTVLTVSATIRYITLPLSIGFRAARHFWVLVVLQTISMTAAAPIVVVLIQKHGAIGGAYGTVALSLSFAIIQVPAALWYLRPNGSSRVLNETPVGLGLHSETRDAA